MKMSLSLHTFLTKISDAFPIGGGAAGAVSQVKEFTYLPTWEAVISAVVVAIIGATVGYFVKLGWDIVFRKLKKKLNVS